jgi:hypothetical protein
MKLKHFASPYAVLAYIRDELVATLHDDLNRQEGDERARYTDEDREEMRNRIADVEAILPRLILAPVVAPVVDVPLVEPKPEDLKGLPVLHHPSGKRLSHTDVKCPMCGATKQVMISPQS